jgi:hypothetical protein
MQKDDYWSGSKREYLSLISLIGLILIPVVLFIIPFEWLKDQHSICLYKLFTGHECYGCGITRAILSAIHFKFAEAIGYNKLVIIVLPILTFIWAKKILNLWSGKLTVSRHPAMVNIKH